MRISLLQQREQFGAIFEKTLADFLSAHCGEPHRVTWRQSTKSSHGSGQSWFCNPFLNIIFRSGVQHEPLQPAIKEFSRSARPWLTPLNMLYVALATGRLSSRLFATATVEIEPPLPHAEKKVFIGGNHHIRLLDYQSRCCVVICKHDFNREFLLNDLAVRNVHQFLPTPRIIEQSDAGSWYSEELILGSPINRLKCQRQAYQAVKQVMEPLLRLYKMTMIASSRLEYAESIVGRIGRLIDRNDLLTHVLRSKLETGGRRLANIACGGAGDISTVQAHGDFQPANILVGDEGPWLIDWEYTNRRQSGYDGLVYCLSSRRTKGLARRIQQALEGSLPTKALLREWPGMRWNEHATQRLTLALFMLEELELKLLEIDNKHFLLLDTGFLSFCQELELIVSLLEKQDW